MNSDVSADKRGSSPKREVKAVEKDSSESTEFPSVDKLLLTQSPDNAKGISYSPLNKEKDEIRLIKILPCTAQSSRVRCTLETVSLSSLTLEYQHFISVSSSTGRKRVVDWTNTHSSSSMETSDEEETMDKYTPTASSYRFTWGDYAALSYVWGDESQTESIILNNKEVLVRRNLEVALRAISSRPILKTNINYGLMRSVSINMTLKSGLTRLAGCETFMVMHAQ
jgi:hypothetical protein